MPGNLRLCQDRAGTVFRYRDLHFSKEISARRPMAAGMLAFSGSEA